MDPSTAKLIEFGLVFGGVLAIAVWQWISVRRELRRDARRQPDAGPTGADAERSRPP